MDKLDKIARIVLAIQRAGNDHLGSVESIHHDFMDLIKMIPKESEIFLGERYVLHNPSQIKTRRVMSAAKEIKDSMFNEPITLEIGDFEYQGCYFTEKAITVERVVPAAVKGHDVEQ